MLTVGDVFTWRRGDKLDGLRGLLHKKALSDGVFCFAA